MNLHVIRAIFKRNFVSYFSNPTGYVFICVFVLLSSFAAFWPNDFFNSNLANLDQLNKYLPYILLVFIPAITMSIWADERRQGTDELLLTIPAGDIDVVLGKYLAAVAIFTVSLLFSLVSNYLVLLSLGDPDAGLITGTYVGYWIVGLAMLAIGMVASFLTGNLTVGFILVALFNAPLAFAGAVPESFNVLNWNVSLEWLKRFSITEQFRDFSRGVISMASLGYFLALVAVMLYLSVVLLGRRHWRGGQEGQGVATHYAVRFGALVITVLALSVFLSRHDQMRVDVTSEGLSSLAPQSRQLLRNLDPKRPVVIEYFVSPNVPESFVQTRLNLLAAVREMQAASGGKVQVIGHNVEPFSEEATRAEQQFDIRPMPVESRTRGSRSQEEIFMGLVVSCGLDTVKIPFLGKGIPVEYELVRSIATVSQQKRKKLGVLQTDAKLYAQFDMQTMSPGRNEQIIEELQKQYDVVQVDPTNPITEKYDVLLAVQPSSLGPDQMKNFINAVVGGQPTAIFEDPFPLLAGDVPGTKAPKQPPGGGNMFMQQRQPPQPKGDIGPLWKALGLDFGGDNVVWQAYNPYPKLGRMPREWVFVDYGSGANHPFNTKNAISSKLQQVLFLFPGAVTGLNSSQLKFTELVSTGDHTGTVPWDKILERNFMGQPRLNPDLGLAERPTNDKYVLAAQIQGKLKPENVPMSDKPAEAAEDKPVEEKAADDKVADDKAVKDAAAKVSTANQQGEGNAADTKSGDEKAVDAKPADAKGDTKAADGKVAEKKEPEINVVVVADIDCLYSAFFALRARGDDADDEFEFKFDNVPFVLNVLDTLAGDERFVAIRTRRPAHRVLTKVNEATEKAKEEADRQREKFVKKYEETVSKAQKEFDDKIAELQKQQGGNSQQATVQFLATREADQRKLAIRLEKFKQERDREIKKAERGLAQEVRKVQDHRKLWAVLLPPIPPLIVAFIVFFNRRAREREGVSKARLR